MSDYRLETVPVNHPHCGIQKLGEGGEIEGGVNTLAANLPCLLPAPKFPSITPSTPALLDSLPGLQPALECASLPSIAVDSLPCLVVDSFPQLAIERGDEVGHEVSREVGHEGVIEPSHEVSIKGAIELNPMGGNELSIKGRIESVIESSIEPGDEVGFAGIPNVTPELNPIGGNEPRVRDCSEGAREYHPESQQALTGELASSLSATPGSRLRFSGVQPVGWFDLIEISGRSPLSSHVPQTLTHQRVLLAGQLFCWQWRDSLGWA